MNKLTRTSFACLCLLPLGVDGQTLHTIRSNGPPANLYNIVLLSEGYTSAQLGQFHVDAANAIDTLLSREPFREYAPSINAWAIAIASPQSGSDHPNSGVYKSTYFNSSYDAYSDRIITIPQNNTGQGRVNSLVQSLAPGHDLSILLVNDVVPGGSEGAENTAIASIAALDVLIHELGHVIANLGDEYSLPYPGYPDTEEPNTTRETDREQIKWKAWIDSQTPVPTPPIFDYENSVGLFEGAHYHSTGWFRPKQNCTMQSLYTPEFCEVCREALTLALAARVEPVLSAAPASPALATSDPLSLSLNLLQPATHNLEIEWRLNGDLVESGQGSTLAVPLAELVPGQNTVEAVISDPTAFVRTDPFDLLRATNSWVIIKPVVELSAPARPTPETFAFSITSPGQPHVVIESSSDLINWNPVATNALVNGYGRFTNTQASIPSRLYFRARLP